MLGFPSANHLTHAMMVCHLSGGDKPNVTIFTNGSAPTDPATKEAMDAARSAGCVIDERVIQKLIRAPNEQTGLDIHFQNNSSSLRMGFLLDKPPTHPVAQEILIHGLGIEIVPAMFGTCVKRTEPFGETNIKGCFVAGDAGSPMTQVTLAVAQGVMAAGGISAQLCAEEGERVLAGVKKVGVEEVEVQEGDGTQCVK